MGDATSPDLKITDVSSYGFIVTNSSEGGTLAPNVNIRFGANNFELSYHKDGSPLYKSLIKGNPKPWRSNYLQQGYRQIPITNCIDILPLVNFQIRRPEIYKSSPLDKESSKRTVYVCSNEMLFTEHQTLFAIIYARNNKIPLSQVTTKDYYSDIITSLTTDIDLCIYICRHTYPSPSPYYDKELKGWITPYPCNSVSFCDQNSAVIELKSKLDKCIFNETFAYFMNVLSDGNIFHLTEDKLLILDEIDIFFNTIHTPIIHKPQFAKFVLEIFKDNTSEFNGKSSKEKQNVLKGIWNIILIEGKNRNWFNK